jgi:hypothetical protein
MTRCGEKLSQCRCVGPMTRTPDEVESAHREAVRRAQARDWARRPVPVWVIGVLAPSLAWNSERVA